MHGSRSSNGRRRWSARCALPLLGGLLCPIGGAAAPAYSSAETIGSAAASIHGSADARSRTAAPIRVGSKTFAESHVLAELVAQNLEQDGFTVERRFGLGGTLVLWQALLAGAIDIYPEYSGTLSQTILQTPAAALPAVRAALARHRILVPATLGFNNSYALAIDGGLARERAISRISQLAQAADLRLGFSLEFLHRADGWPALQAHYGLPQAVTGLEHALAYRAIARRELDVTDAYTTDGDLEAFDLVLLSDDRDFFPRYDALLLARDILPDAARQRLVAMEGSLDETTIRRLNAEAVEPGVTPGAVVAAWLGNRHYREASVARQIAGNTAIHLQLTGTALALACLLGLPLALWLTRRARAAAAVLYVAGLLQTIPSLALLAILIPVLGLGSAPAIVALFLYSLLPIIRNTLTGIATVDPLLREVARGMGLNEWQQLRHVEIPLALPTILAGIKTAAIISIGTATLAAFVGAGGLGEPIVTGLSLNDHGLVLQGAIPAALLAVMTEFLFECLERLLSPGHWLRAS